MGKITWNDVVPNTLTPKRFATSIGGHAWPLPKLADRIQMQILTITSTGAPIPVLGKGMVEKTQKLGRQTMFMIDLAVPRDIEPEVDELDSIYLYTIDDLPAILEEAWGSGNAARQAETLIEKPLMDGGVKSWLQSG